jgi:transcription initiation factor TFIIE subunit beta
MTLDQSAAADDLNGSFKRKREDSLGGGPPSSILHVAAGARPAKKPATDHHPALIKHLTQTERYLKEKAAEKSFDDIVNYLSIQYADKNELAILKLFLQQKANKVMYDPKGLDGKGSYKYRPKIAVSNSVELKRYLQRSKDSRGVRFEDLKDGWPNCADTLDAMESAGELLIVRDKRQAIRTVWQDDPTLIKRVRGDTKRIWDEIKLPANADDIRARLKSVGLTPTTGGGPKVKPGLGGRPNKRKVPRKGGRITNTHITGLKDYSHLRAGK